MNTLPRKEENIKRTIIIVEDDFANAEVLALLLQTQNTYEVLRFSGGAEVLASLNRIKEMRPALFLLDYQLSGMTALDLYERLQTIEELEKIPTIIISASTLSEEQKEYLQQLNLTLIPKPYDIEHLLAVIEQTLI